VNAREEILARIAAAVPESVAVDVQRTYRGASGEGRGGAKLVALFEDRLVDYRATFGRVEPDHVAPVIASALVEAGVRSVVVPAGFPAEWLPAGVAVADDPPLSSAELDAVDGVLTTCRIAVAETGTIVLDGGAGQGRRAVSLVPDYHLVVVRADQVVATVPDAIAELDPTRAMTWISGPSATSDIELQRVEGVHGPRRLEVLLVTAWKRGRQGTMGAGTSAAKGRI